MNIHSWCLPHLSEFGCDVDAHSKIGGVFLCHKKIAKTKRVDNIAQIRFFMIKKGEFKWKREH